MQATVDFNCKFMEVSRRPGPDIDKLLWSVISLSSTRQQWRNVAAGFKDFCGFPLVAGAIDGSIFQLERPLDYEG
jgi:hypothetical protein